MWVKIFTGFINNSFLNYLGMCVSDCLGAITMWAYITLRVNK